MAALKKTLQFLAILGPIIIGISQLIPASAPIWSLLGTEREIIVNLLSFYFLILGSTLILEIKEHRETTIAELGKIVDASKHHFIGKQIPDHEFYLDFLNEMRKAKRTVCISYFAPYPPDTTNHQDRAEYYRKIKKIIKGNPKVHFRRLIRYTDKNKPWIKELLRDFSGVPNFDLAVIRDLEDANVKLSYALSAQIIDSQKCWLVAIESHENQNAYRDVYLEGSAISESMQGYYARLWNLSEELIVSGVLTQEGIRAENQW